MTSFLADFVHTDYGFTCSGSGFRDLSNAQDCSSAASYAKSFNSMAHYYSKVFWGTKPRGCVIWNYNGEMYFNTHPTGGSSNKVTSICWKGNT